MRVSIFQIVLLALNVITALSAALFWLLSATSIVTSEEANKIRKNKAEGNDNFDFSSISINDIDVEYTMIKQSNFNKLAASFACLNALIQVVTALNQKVS